MEKLFNWISVLVAVGGGFLVNLFGEWDVALTVLLTLMALDYITGLAKGVYNKNLSSEIGWKGLLKKLMTLCIIIVANELQKLLGNNIALRDIVIMFYTANEGLSILENVAAVSNNIPQALKDVLLQLRDKE